MTFSTLARVASRTVAAPLMTRETVPTPTPDAAATSAIVARRDDDIVTLPKRNRLEPVPSANEVIVAPHRRVVKSLLQACYATVLRDCPGTCPQIMRLMLRSPLAFGAPYRRRLPSSLVPRSSVQAAPRPPARSYPATRRSWISGSPG